MIYIANLSSLYLLCIINKTDIDDNDLLSQINEKQISLKNNLHIIYNDGKPPLIIAWEPRIMTLSLVHLETGLWVGLTRNTLVRILWLHFRSSSVYKSYV